MDLNWISLDFDGFVQILIEFNWILMDCIDFPLSCIGFSMFQPNKKILTFSRSAEGVRSGGRTSFHFVLLCRTHFRRL